MSSFSSVVGAYREVHNCAMGKASEDPAKSSRSNSRSDELERTIRAFTLAGDNAKPAVGTSWVEFADSDLNMADFGVISMTARDEGALRDLTTQTVDEHAIKIVDNYLNLTGEVANICDVAIDRINLGRRRFYPGNRAIEGCIGLEALMLTDKQKEELSYRVRLRCALLLGSNLEERRQIKKPCANFTTCEAKPSMETDQAILVPATSG